MLTRSEYHRLYIDILICITYLKCFVDLDLKQNDNIKNISNQCPRSQSVNLVNEFIFSFKILYLKFFTHSFHDILQMSNE